MPKTRTQKEETVVKVTGKLNRAKSVVLADYKGMNMSQMSGLRKELRDQGAEFGVIKNSLLDLALKQADLKLASPEAQAGPTAVLFAYEDEITPIKSLVKSFKASGIGKVKAGFLGKDFFDAISLDRLATLPSKQELQGKVVGMLNAPLVGIVGVLQANLRNLVYVLDAIADKRQGSASAS